MQQRFFKAYLEMLYGDRRGAVGTLIDSVGLPSASRTRMVQISNRNGEMSSQVRLIYVVDRNNSMPIYLRPVQGSVDDVRAVGTTLSMLAQYGVEVDWSILDADYYSSQNVLELMEVGIKFVVRVSLDLNIVTNFIGKDLSALNDIECAENAVVYGNRIFYMVCHETEVAGRRVWLYIGVDPITRSNARQRVTLMGLDEKKSFDEIDRQVHELGAFAMISNEKMERSEVLPLYYTRKRVDQDFDVTKHNTVLLPLRMANELALNGYLLLSFAANAVLQLMQQVLIAKKSKISIKGALSSPRNHKVKVFDHALVPYESAVENAAIYRAFEVEGERGRDVGGRSRRSRPRVDFVGRIVCRSLVPRTSTSCQLCCASLPFDAARHKA